MAAVARLRSGASETRRPVDDTWAERRGEDRYRGSYDVIGNFPGFEGTVPDPQDPDTFTRSKLDWAERERGMHARMLSLYRELISLRRRIPDLTDPAFGALHAEADESARWFRLRRGGTEILVNFASAPVTISVPDAATALLVTDDGCALDDGEAVLPGRSAMVVALAPQH